MKKILFVCLGNICRSPMAEGLFMKQVKDMGLENELYAESRATSNYEIGRPPHIGTRRILDSVGYDISYKKAKQITYKDIDEFDYIIGMDHENIKDIKKIAKDLLHKVYLFRDINPDTKNMIVKDPYYDNTHMETYKVLNAEISKWIEFVLNEK